MVSDYGASKDTAGNMNDGLDFIPDEGQVDFSYQPQLIQAALATGQVSRPTLDAHARRILRTLFAYGVFDRPGYSNDDSQINVAAHQRIAEQTEEGAITLLKNDGILPLKPGIKKIAVIGPYANRFVRGGGSGAVTPRQVVTVLQGIIARADRAGSGPPVVSEPRGAQLIEVSAVSIGAQQAAGRERRAPGRAPAPPSASSAGSGAVFAARLLSDMTWCRSPGRCPRCPSA